MGTSRWSLRGRRRADRPRELNWSDQPYGQAALGPSLLTGQGGRKYPPFWANRGRGPHGARHEMALRTRDRSAARCATLSIRSRLHPGLSRQQSILRRVVKAAAPQQGSSNVPLPNVPQLREAHHLEDGDEMGGPSTGHPAKFLRKRTLAHRQGGSTSWGNLICPSGEGRPPGRRTEDGRDVERRTLDIHLLGTARSGGSIRIISCEEEMRCNGLSWL